MRTMASSDGQAAADVSDRPIAEVDRLAVTFGRGSRAVQVVSQSSLSVRRGSTRVRSSPSISVPFFGAVTVIPGTASMYAMS